MTELGDDRVQFYFRHKDQIDEWAGLIAEARSATHEFLHGLLEDLSALASDLGIDDAEPEDLEVSRGGVLLLRKAHWPRLHDGRPEIGIGLGWERGALPVGANTPYTGLRISQD